MSKQSVDLFQSFCRKYYNKAVKEHFRDVEGNNSSDLSIEVPRQLIKRVCLHEPNDSLLLTIARLLIWWVEAKGLFDEFIYGIPSTDFEISNTYYPQVKLHFREDKYQAATNNRRPARGEVSFRWREADYSTLNVTNLAKKIKAELATTVFSYQRGRELWSYADKSKGYYFQMTVNNETTAKEVIRKVINIQDEGEPDWENYLRYHKDKKSYSTPGTVRVMGETVKKPKKRPIALVKFAYAELFIPGTTKPIVLVDRTRNKHNALIYA